MKQNIKPRKKGSGGARAGAGRKIDPAIGHKKQAKVKLYEYQLKWYKETYGTLQKAVDALCGAIPPRE